MQLFHYPKVRHKRKLSPGPFTVYRTYKKYLKTEFDAICVYCRMPDFLSEVNSYAVEHYRPKTLFPELETEYLNLFYSCCICNNLKSSFWPDKNDESLGRFIPNPCDYVMHNHLRSQTEGTVKPHSLAGVWTIGLLDLNAPLRIKKRLFYLNIIKQCESTIVCLKKQHAKLKGSEVNTTPKKSVYNDIVEVEEKISELEEIIKTCGA